MNDTLKGVFAGVGITLVCVAVGVAVVSLAPAEAGVAIAGVATTIIKAAT